MALGKRNYPGTTRTGEATILTIEPGSNATAVDFTVLRIPPPAFPELVLPVVNGRVVVEGGGPPPFFLGTLYIYASGAAVRLRFGEDGQRIRGSGTYGATPARRDGAFSMLLPDGEYSVSLVTSVGDPLSAPDGYYVKSMTFGAADIMGRKFQVSGNSRPAITITLAAGSPPTR